MLENFLYAFNTVMPLMVIIALGFILKKKKIFSENFFKFSDRLVFRFLLPCQLFRNIYDIESIHDFDPIFVAYVVLGIIILYVLGSLTAKLFVPNKSSRSVAVQCAFRSDAALLGLPLAVSLGGTEAAAAMSLVIAVGVPVYNFLAVLVLSTGSGAKMNFRKVLKSIITNPLIIGCVSALILVAVRSFMPVNSSGAPVFSISGNLKFLYSAICSLGAIATTLALLNIGGLLDFSSIDLGGIKTLSFGCVWRMLLAPVLFITIAAALKFSGISDFGPAQFAVLLSFFGAPVAIASAPMAAEMNADADLARQYILCTCLLLFITLPVFIMIMLSLGLL